MADWRDKLAIVTHPPAFAEFSVDLGPIRITIDGTERDLVGASFRGVSFFVESSDREGGRRTVTHEFPLRNDPFVEDLGLKARVYKLEGYVIGHKYIDQRDKLLDALEDKDEAGPGPLIHPYYGQKLCLAGKFSVKELRDEGGIAKFSIEFLETPKDPPFPAFSLDLGSLLGAILGAIAAVIASIALLALAIVLAVLTVRALLRACEAFLDSLVDLFTLLDGDDAALFFLRIEAIRVDLPNLVRKPTELLNALNKALDGMQGADAKAAMEGLLAVATLDVGPAPPRQAAYFNAFVRAIRTLCLMKAIGHAARVSFDSQAAAVAARDRLATVLDALAEEADENVYASLIAVRAELAQQVPRRGRDLPQVVPYLPPATTPSLVLAYRLYGSTRLEGDIVARNNLPHPGFVLGGSPSDVGLEGGGGIGRELEVLALEGGGGIG